MHQTESNYSWVVFPMLDNPGKGVFFWLVLIVTTWAVYYNMQSLLFTIVAALVLLGSTTAFYLPNRYWIDQEGIHLKRWKFQRDFNWDRIRSVYIESKGVFLSPFPEKTRLENFRGFHLMIRDNRDQVVEELRKYIPDVKGMPSN